MTENVQGLALPGLAKGTTAMITGGTGAIGRAVAEAMASLGMAVGVLGRSEQRVQQVAAEIDPVSAMPLVADVSDTAAVEKTAAAMVDRFGSLDVLVHAAAVSEGAVGLADITDQQIDEVLRINVRGSLVVARAVAPVMMRQGRGRIVNVASVAAHQAMPGRVIYGTSKAALVHLTRQLAAELGPYGITVNSMSPGQTPSHITLVGDAPGAIPQEKTLTPGEAGVERIPLRRRGQLEDFVGPILFLASDLAAYVTGADLSVEGGTLILR
ncbi:MAG: SDR family oxidoreductase [Acidimicrobiia bacterium]|nr:SDR family oxidoreductase [Acidimicrobiia bacterium]